MGWEVGILYIQDWYELSFECLDCELSKIVTVVVCVGKLVFEVFITNGSNKVTGNLIINT